MAANITSLPRVAEDEVIDLRYLVYAWLKWIWVPIVLAGIGAYLGYRDLQQFAPQSTASMIVLPASSGQAAPAGRVESIAGQFGMQLGTPTQSVSSFYRLQVLLGSHLLAERLQERYGLLQRVYAGSWDGATNTWKRPAGEDFERDQRIRAMLRQNLWQPPSIESVAVYVKGKVRIEPVEGGAFQKISVTDSDPQFALWLLQAAYEAADELLREQDRRDVFEREAYINRELSNTQNILIADALRGMLASELNRKAMLSGDMPYAAKITEPARLSARKTEPNLRVLFGLPMVGMAAAGFFIVTLIAVARRERRR